MKFKEGDWVYGDYKMAPNYGLIEQTQINGNIVVVRWARSLDELKTLKNNNRYYIKSNSNPINLKCINYMKSPLYETLTKEQQ